MTRRTRRRGTAFRNVCLTTAAIVISLTPRSHAAGFLFVEEPVNPAVTAMGSAGAALGYGGFSFYNPAALAAASKPYASFEYGIQPGGLHKSLVEGGWVFPTWFLGAGFLSHTTDFAVTDERTDIEELMALGDRGGSFGSYQGALASMYAGLIRDRFAVAVSASGLQDRIHTDGAYALTAGGGVLYRALPGKLDLGAAVFHVGRTTGYLDSTVQWHKTGVPRSGRAGGAWHDTIGSMPYTAAVDIVYTRDWNRVMVPVGIELWPLPYLAVRAGRRFGMALDDFTEIMTAGIGVRYGSLRFDAAFVPTRLQSDTELKWLMGLTYSLKDRAPRAVPPVQATVPIDKIETEERGGTVVETDSVARPVPDGAGGDTSDVQGGATGPAPQGSEGTGGSPPSAVLQGAHSDTVQQTPEAMESVSPDSSADPTLEVDRDSTESAVPALPREN